VTKSAPPRRNRVCPYCGQSAVSAERARSGPRAGRIICRVATVVPAEGVILKRVLEAAPHISPEGLSHEAYAKFDAAQTKTAWGRRHRRRFALVDGAAVIASATQYDLAAVFEQQPVRVCGIGAILTPPAHRTRAAAMELVERLLDEAARNGATMALRFSDVSHEHQPASTWLPCRRRS
jgi:hypothetical protein